MPYNYALRLPDAMRDELRRLAYEEHVSVNAIIVGCIEAVLEDKRREWATQAEPVIKYKYRDVE